MLSTLENQTKKEVSNEHKSLLDSKSKNTMDKSVNTIKQKEPYLDSIADLKHVSSECELYCIDLYLFYLFNIKDVSCYIFYNISIYLFNWCRYLLSLK